MNTRSWATRAAGLAMIVMVLAGCSDTESTTPATSSPPAAANTSTVAAQPSAVETPAEAPEAQGTVPATDGQRPAPNDEANNPQPAPPTDPNEPPASGTYCGDGYNGLAVWSYGPDCATTMAVQQAYGSKLADSDSKSAAVTVDGVDWTCGEVQVLNRNPYLECYSNAGGVRLTS